MTLENIIHIGLPKTGSTTLQNVVFANLNSYLYIGKHKNNFSNIFAKEIVARIARSDSLEYDEEHILRLVEKIRYDYGNTLPFLVSDEVLSVEGKADRRLIAGRLHSVFAPAKIIIIIRAQPRLCASLYLNFIKSSGKRRISFNSWLDKTYGQIDPGFYRVSLNYLSLINLYREIFGFENVFIFPIEIFSSIAGQMGVSSIDGLSGLLGVRVDWMKSRLYERTDNRRQTIRFQRLVDFQNRLPGHVNLALLGRALLPHQVYK